MKLNKTKPKFKKSSFAFVDMLATKKMILERPEEVIKQNLEPINNNYHINNLIEQIHPKNQQLKVSKIVNITPTVKKIKLVPVNNKIAIFRPGQYINICFEIDGKKINRPYSLANSLKESYEETIMKLQSKINLMVMYQILFILF